MGAIDSGYFDVFTEILKNGADINAKTYRGKLVDIVLHYMVMSFKR